MAYVDDFRDKTQNFEAYRNNFDTIFTNNDNKTFQFEVMEDESNEKN